MDNAANLQKGAEAVGAAAGPWVNQMTELYQGMSGRGLPQEQAGTPGQFSGLPKVDLCDTQNLGSAAAVGCVLREVGQTAGHSISASTLAERLRQQGYTKEKF